MASSFGDDASGSDGESDGPSDQSEGGFGQTLLLIGPMDHLIHRQIQRRHLRMTMPWAIPLLTEKHAGDSPVWPASPIAGYTSNNGRPQCDARFIF